MRIYSFFLTSFAFGFFLIAILVTFRRRDKLSLCLWLFTIAVAGWALASAIYLNEYKSIYLTGLWARIGHIFAPFIPATWINFVFIFIGKKPPFKYFYPVVYIYSFVMMCLVPFESYMITPTELGVNICAFSGGPLYFLFMIYFFIIVLLGFFHLAKSFHAATGLQRQQIKYLLLATGFGYFGGGCWFFPIYGINWPVVLTILMPTYPIFMGIALIKYGLFSETDLAYAAHKDKLATIGTLATSINHEIKNPLYVISGLADSFLQNRNENLYANDSKALTAAEDIIRKSKQQTERAVEIMRNFSAFAKQGVAEEPELKKISISAVALRILPFLSYELKLEKVTIKNQLMSDIAHIQADERYLEEILFNLIINSCQAMKQTGGELELSAKQEAGKVVVEIKDNGPGISKERQKQIFEPFYTTKEEGTGLGLYITKQLVEKIGGKIALTSEEGKGTIFRLEFAR